MIVVYFINVSCCRERHLFAKRNAGSHRSSGHQASIASEQSLAQMSFLEKPGSTIHLCY